MSTKRKTKLAAGETKPAASETKVPMVTRQQLWAENGPYRRRCVLQQARNWLDACLGRMKACGEHDVSVEEIPRWMAEIDTVLAGWPESDVLPGGQEMMFMNRGEVESAAAQQHDCPNVRAGYHLLKLLMDATDRQSDGWCYWPKPAQSAQRLQELLKTAGNPMFPTHGKITKKQLRGALTPIKAMVTRERTRQKQYGNTFEFDVEAALMEAQANGT